MTWMQTFTGMAFDYANPHPDNICIADIARGLAQTNRFNGHTKFPYSVAQHCTVLFDYVAARRPLDKTGLRWVLLHDASEAYMCDLPSPLKALLPDYKTLEARVMAAVCVKYDLPLESPAWLKYLDTAVCLDERSALTAATSLLWEIESFATALGVHIEEITPKRAEDAFLHRWQQVAP